MAFNPFNVFRRNQKILFAILTIIIMIMFVFSTGLGRGIDFFDWVPRWLGSKGSRGEVMAVIDGDAIRESELERLRERRELANQYMVAAYGRASENLFRYVIDGLTRVQPENRTVFQNLLMAQ